MAARALTTRSIVIATGARPFVPPIPGIDTVGYLTPTPSGTCANCRAAGGARRRPDRCRADAGLCPFRRTGDAGGDGPTHHAARDDPKFPALVRQRFEAEGVAVLVNHRANAVRDRERRRLSSPNMPGRMCIPFDALLVAVGRAANLSGFGLEELGVPTGKTRGRPTSTCRPTSQHLRRRRCRRPFQFTHTAAHQAWYAAVNALFDPRWMFRPTTR